MMENSSPIDIDRISNLPDELLCLILSYLPINDAFYTTLLSKRWAAVYRSLTYTSLYIDDESIRDELDSLCFCRFVDKVTISTQLVKSYYLNFRPQHWPYGYYYFGRWVGTAKRHPLEILQICSSVTTIPPIRPSIFIFPTLVILKLQWVHVVGNISVDLPLLKTLHLFCVSFKNKKYFKKILFGCPVLEDLQAAIYENDTVEAENFKYISKLITAYSNPDVEILTLTIYNRPPNIKSYYTYFSGFQNIMNLDVRFINFQHWDDLVEVLQYCPKLQNLYILIKCTPDKELSLNWKYPNSVPECISSHLRSCTFCYKGREDKLQFAKYILQNARLLEVMKIKIIDNLEPKPSRGPLEELSSCPMISPKCKLSIQRSKGS